MRIQERKPGLAVGGVCAEDLRGRLAEAKLDRARPVDRHCQAVEVPVHPFARLDPLLEGGAAEFSECIGEIFEDRGGLAEIAAVAGVDEKRNLAVALLCEIGGLLVLAAGHVHMDIVEGLTAERKHQPHLVGRAGCMEAV